MKNLLKTATLCLPLVCAGLAQASDSPTLLEAKELKWIDAASPAAAKQAVLWGDSKATDQGVLLRWKFNSKVRDQVRTQDAHFVVMTGTFTVEIDGKYREFGPGGFVSIPKGIKHSLGCEASGECKFVMHTIGTVDTIKSSPGQ